MLVIWSDDFKPYYDPIERLYTEQEITERVKELEEALSGIVKNAKFSVADLSHDCSLSTVYKSFPKAEIDKAKKLLEGE